MELVIKSFNVSREFDELKIILMMNLEINSFAQRKMNTWQTQEPLTMITAAVSFPTIAVQCNKAASNEQRHFFNTSYLH